MSKIRPIENAWSSAYESPKVTAETLDDGGNYVSPASPRDGAPLGSSDPGTLGNSLIE
jgi:hypothetical protein